VKRLTIALATCLSLLAVLFVALPSPSSALPRVAVSDSSPRISQWRYLPHVVIRTVASAVSLPTSYVVQAGNTLSSIAQSQYGNSATWPSLWYVNRKQVTNPNNISVGERLILSTWHPVAGWLTVAAENAIPKPPPAPVTQTPVTVQSAPVQTVQVSSGSFESCVITRESGGNPDAQNPDSTASGLFGFLDTTWDSVMPGYPAPARDWSVAIQDEGFNREYAQDGMSPWDADGCPYLFGG
jgi:hypothetical protein